MPRYEYKCDANERTVEVTHGMNERLGTWGEVCEKAGIDLGGTAASERVEKVFSLSFVSGGSAPDMGGGCGPGCGCVGHN